MSKNEIVAAQQAIIGNVASDSKTDFKMTELPDA